MGGKDHCSVFKCANRRGKPGCQEFSFHRIPAKQPQRNLWIRAISRRDKPTKNWVVCSAHFVERHPSKDSENVDFVPTLNMGKPEKVTRPKIPRLNQRLSQRANVSFLPLAEVKTETEEHDVGVRATTVGFPREVRPLQDGPSCSLNQQFHPPDVTAKDGGGNTMTNCTTQAPDTAKLQLVGYSEWLLEEMYCLWTQEKLCNLTIKTKDGTCKAHLSVLAANSPLVLKAIPSDSGNNVPFHSILDLSWSEVSVAIMTQILHFCYTGSMAADNRATVMEIMQAAKKLQFQKIVAMCYAFCSSKWSPVVKHVVPSATSANVGQHNKNQPRKEAGISVSVMSHQRKRAGEDNEGEINTKRQCIQQEMEPTGSLLMTVSGEKPVTIKKEIEDSGYDVGIGREAVTRVSSEAETQGDIKSRTDTLVNTESLVSYKCAHQAQNGQEANIMSPIMTSFSVTGCRQRAAPVTATEEQLGSRVEMLTSDQDLQNSSSLDEITFSMLCTATEDTLDETVLVTPEMSRDGMPVNVAPEMSHVQSSRHIQTLPEDLGSDAKGNCATSKNSMTQGISGTLPNSKGYPEENLTGYYSCSACGLPLRDEAAMKTHVQQIHCPVEKETWESYEYVQPWPCHVCGMLFLIKASCMTFVQLEVHVQREHSQDMLVYCKLCETVMPKGKPMSQSISHLNKYHGVPYSLVAKHFAYITTPNDLDLSWTNHMSCDPFQFLSQRRVKPFCCFLCWDNYDNERACLDHLQNRHCVQKLWARKFLRYVISVPCNWCNKMANLTTGTGDMFVEHLRRDHRSNTKIVCKVCDTSVTSMTNLVHHLHRYHSHQADTKRTIDYCNFTFFTNVYKH